MLLLDSRGVFLCCVCTLALASMEAHKSQHRCCFAVVSIYALTPNLVSSNRCFLYVALSMIHVTPQVESRRHWGNSRRYLWFFRCRDSPIGVVVSTTTTQEAGTSSKRRTSIRIFSRRLQSNYRRRLSFDTSHPFPRKCAHTASRCLPTSAHRSDFP